MTLNIFLALLGVAFGYFFLYVKNFYFKALFFSLWLLFIPNTIYLVTDIEHFWGQFLKLSPIYQGILIGQYLTIIIIGIITFCIGVYPLEKSLSKVWSQKRALTITFLVLVNYLIALGVMMGRIERVNSWDVFIEPLNVINSGFNLLISPPSLLLVLLYGSFCNILYFLFVILKKHD